MELIVMDVSDVGELKAIKDLVESKFGKKKYIGVFRLEEKFFCLVMDKLLAKLTFVTLDSLRSHLEKNLYEVNLEKSNIKKVSKSSIDKLFSSVAKKILSLLLICMSSDKIARLSIGNDLLDEISITITDVEGGVKIENKILLEKLFNSQQK